MLALEKLAINAKHFPKYAEPDMMRCLRRETIPRAREGRVLI